MFCCPKKTKRQRKIRLLKKNVYRIVCEVICILMHKVNDFFYRFLLRTIFFSVIYIGAKYTLVFCYFCVLYYTFVVQMILISIDSCGKHVTCVFLSMTDELIIFAFHKSFSSFCDILDNLLSRRNLLNEISGKLFSPTSNVFFRRGFATLYLSNYSNC